MLAVFLIEVAVAVKVGGTEFFYSPFFNKFAAYQVHTMGVASGKAEQHLMVGCGQLAGRCLIEIFLYLCLAKTYYVYTSYLQLVLYGQ